MIGKHRFSGTLDKENKLSVSSLALRNVPRYSFSSLFAHNKFFIIEQYNIFYISPDTQGQFLGWSFPAESWTMQV